MVQEGLTLEAGTARITARLTQPVERQSQGGIGPVPMALIGHDLWCSRWH